MGKIIVCKKCGEIKPHIAKGLCRRCYKQPKRICKRCNQLKNHQGKGLCRNCYNKTFRYHIIKDANIRKWHNIGFDEWKKITKSCIICGFDMVVELHHIDRDHNNNSSQNMVGLCPNHHRMIHNSKFKRGVEIQLKYALSKACT